MFDLSSDRVVTYLGPGGTQVTWDHQRLELKKPFRGRVKYLQEPKKKKKVQFLSGSLTMTQVTEDLHRRVTELSPKLRN